MKLSWSTFIYNFSNQMWNARTTYNPKKVRKKKDLWKLRISDLLWGHGKICTRKDKKICAQVALEKNKECHRRVFLKNINLGRSKKET